MKAPKFHIGFFHYAGYSKLIIERTEAEVLTSMRVEYFKWKEQYTDPRTWKEAFDYYGWHVEEASTSAMIDY